MLAARDGGRKEPMLPSDIRKNSKELEYLIGLEKAENHNRQTAHTDSAATAHRHAAKRQRQRFQAA